MLRDLTVEEVITHSARTRLPADWTDAQRAALVEEVIEVLGLRGVRGSVVGGQGSGKRGISGGERKVRERSTRSIAPFSGSIFKLMLPQTARECWYGVGGESCATIPR